jgi:hypothetical protein
MAENTFRNSNKKKFTFFKGLEKTVSLNPEQRLPGGEVAIKYLPHFLFLALLAVIYIGNVHYGERMIRETSKMENEVENLRSDYASLKAKYDSYTGKQINIAESAKKLGLQESKGRVQKITVK